MGFSILGTTAFSELPVPAPEAAEIERAPRSHTARHTRDCARRRGRTRSGNARGTTSPLWACCRAAVQRMLMSARVAQLHIWQWCHFLVERRGGRAFSQSHSATLQQHGPDRIAVFVQPFRVCDHAQNQFVSAPSSYFAVAAANHADVGKLVGLLCGCNRAFFSH